MNRFFMSILAVWLFTPDLSAQYSDSSETIARSRRATREKAYVHAGASGAARAFVESGYADEVAPRALLNCTEDVATRLAEFHASGGFQKISRTKDLLGLISIQRNGDAANEICLWIIEHPGELVDNDCVSEFLDDSMSYCLSLKSLSKVTAEKRQERLEAAKNIKEPEKKPETESRWSFPTISESTIKGAVALAFMIGLPAAILWWKRRRRGWDSAA